MTDGFALVAGAARGIGQAIAAGLAERGATAVLADVGDLAATAIDLPAALDATGEDGTHRHPSA